MADGSACVPPAGSPNATASPILTTGTATASIPVTASGTAAPTPGVSGATSANPVSSGNANPTNVNKNAADRISSSSLFAGVAAALVAVAAAAL